MASYSYTAITPSTAKSKMIAYYIQLFISSLHLFLYRFLGSPNGLSPWCIMKHYVGEISGHKIINHLQLIPRFETHINFTQHAIWLAELFYVTQILQNPIISWQAETLCILKGAFTVPVQVQALACTKCQATAASNVQVVHNTAHVYEPVQCEAP